MTGIGQEALRHWRRHVPYLAAKSGKAARFSFGDLVALAVTREITEGLGVGISQVHDGIESLFRTLAQQTVIRPDTVAVLQGRVSSLVVADTQLSALSRTPAALVPLGTIIEDLQAKLLDGIRLPPQSVLPFSAEAVSQ